MEWEHRGDHDRASQAQSRAISMQPGHARALNARAWNRQAAGDLEGALADYSSALLADPEWTDTWIRRGKLFLRLSRDDEALADFERALQLKPKSAKALTHRGRVHLSRGQYDEALSDFDRALKISPGYSLAKQSRGAVLEASGNLVEGLKEVGEAILETPSREYRRPRRLSGAAKIAHDFATLIESDTFHINVDQSDIGVVRGLFLPLGAKAGDESVRGLREVWVAKGVKREGEGLLCVGLYVYDSDLSARTLVGLARQLSSARGKKVEQLTRNHPTKVSARASDYRGEHTGEGFRFTLTGTREVDGAQTARTYSTMFSVGSYVLEIAHSNLVRSEDEVNAFCERAIAVLNGQKKRANSGVHSGRR
jgi:tetratricopeptide (TPR) repeat protein